MKYALKSLSVPIECVLSAISDIFTLISAIFLVFFSILSFAALMTSILELLEPPRILVSSFFIFAYNLPFSLWNSFLVSSR